MGSARRFITSNACSYEYAHGVEVEVGQRGKGLHMQFAAVVQSVEATGHEMPAPAFFQQAALAHRDTRLLGHQQSRRI